MGNCSVLPQESSTGPVIQGSAEEGNDDGAKLVEKSDYSIRAKTPGESREEQRG